MTVARKTIRGRLTTLTEAQVQAGARVTLSAVEVLAGGTTRTLDRVADLAGHLLMIGEDTHYVTREGDGSYSFSNVPVTDSDETSPTGYALELKVISGGELVESVVFQLPAADPDEQWIDEIIAMGDSPLTPAYPQLVNEAATSAAAAASSATTASTAATTATTQASAASTARTAAETAEAAAQTAQSAAGTSAGQAASSATAAQTARTGAETARTGAETARTGAETALAGVPAAVTTTITDPASPARTALNNAYAWRWQPNTAYTAGQIVMAPDGSVVKRLTSGTSGSTYNPASWQTIATVAGTQAQAELAAVLAGYALRYANVLTDPGFENGDYSALTGRFSVVSSNAHGGTKALQLTTSGPAGIYTLATTTVVPGDVWRMRAYVKTSSDFFGEAKFRLADPSNAPVGSMFFGLGTDYRQVELSYTVPPGITSLTWQISSAHTAGTVWVDDVDVRQVDTSVVVDAVEVPSPLLLAAGQQAVAETAPLRVADSDLPRRMELVPDGRTTTDLIDGGTSQVFSVSGCTVANDATRRYGANAQSKRVTITGAGTSYFYADPVFPSPAADPLTFPAASTVCALVWVDDPTKLTSFQVEIHQTAGSVIWNRASNATEVIAAQGNLHAGWNFVRFKASAGTLTGWGSVERVRIIAVTTAATAYNVQRVWVESPVKAQMIFIEDRGYRTFVDSGYAAIHALGPITWALDPLTHGTLVGTKNEVITDTDVATFYANGDDLSIHAYDGAATSGKSADAIRLDSLNALKWLQDRGYDRGRRWRAAWTQNTAPNAFAAKPYFAAYATWQAVGSSGHDVWPFYDRWNVPRTGLQGRDTTYIDNMFSILQQTNSLITCYTHGIHVDGITNGGADMTPTDWAYFIGKLTAAIGAGWLELTTFSKLIEQGTARTIGVITDNGDGTATITS